jgi:hypothetical protein
VLDRLGGVLSLGLGSLGAVSGVDEELVSVLSKSFDVGLETFLRSVHSSVVDGDANGPGEVSLDTGGLELSQGETTSKLDSGVVSLGLASDDGSEKGVGSGALLSGSDLSSDLSDLLLGRLVEVGLNPLLPILLEVVVGHSVVVLSHDGSKSKTKEVVYGN